MILLIPPPLARGHLACLELFFVVMTGEILLDCRSWDAAKHSTIHKTQLLRNYQPPHLAPQSTALKLNKYMYSNEQQILFSMIPSLFSSISQYELYSYNHGLHII